MKKSSVFLILSLSLMIAIAGCEKDDDGPSQSGNSAPIIDAVVAERAVIDRHESTAIYCTARDLDGDSLSYLWIPLGGSIGMNYQPAVYWFPPTSQTQDSAAFTVMVRVSDGENFTDDAATVSVVFGDRFIDTGEPYIDEPDSHGVYNHEWDAGEIFFDLPSSAMSGTYGRANAVSTNGVYDPPNGKMDEYELFCSFAPDFSDPRYPVLYTWEDIQNGIHNGGSEWKDLPSLTTGEFGSWAWIEGQSTWRDRDRDQVFDIWP